MLTDSGVIKYVGRGDTTARLGVHAATPGKSNLQQYVIFDNNSTKTEAELLEQRIMGLNGGALPTNEFTNLLNRIRSYSSSSSNAPVHDVVGPSLSCTILCFCRDEGASLMIRVKSMQAGDYFSISMEDGRFAISQIIWLGSESKEQKFKKVFAFAVLSISSSEEVSEDAKYLVFKDHRGSFTVMFTAVDKLKAGEWPILQRGVVSDVALIDFEFNMAGTLYRRGSPVRVLAIEEYQNYILMGVSGFALVEKFLQQY